jgi:LysR family hydrogen peroxide-inducible transcriptional activator
VQHQKGFIGGEFRIGIIPTIMPTFFANVSNNFIKKNQK